MPTIGDLNTITVTGKYLGIDGNPLAGTLTFIPSVPILDPGTAPGLIIMPRAFSVALAGDGSFSVDLPATDDPDVSPVGWVYNLTENFTTAGVTGRNSLPVAVPVASVGGTAELAALLESTVVGTPAINLVTSTQLAAGLAGRVPTPAAAPTANGQVPTVTDFTHDPPTMAWQTPAGGGGAGTVTKVAGVSPDGTGNVPGASLATALNLSAFALQSDVDTELGNEVARADAAYAPIATARNYVRDLIGNRPTPAAFGKGWYFATDDNGGSLYYSDGTTWQRQTLGLNWASGTQLAYAEDAALIFDAKGNGTTFNDLSTALHITIPASSVPVMLRGKLNAQSKTGTAAVAATNTVQVQLADNAGTMLDNDGLPVVQVTAATITWGRSLFVAAVLPAPVSAGTYKLMGRVAAAAPAGWGTIQLLGGGLFPKAWLEAVAE